MNWFGICDFQLDARFGQDYCFQEMLTESSRMKLFQIESFSKVCLVGKNPRDTWNFCRGVHKKIHQQRLSEERVRQVEGF